MYVVIIIATSTKPFPYVCVEKHGKDYMVLYMRLVCTIQPRKEGFKDNNVQKKVMYDSQLESLSHTTHLPQLDSNMENNIP